RSVVGSQALEVVRRIPERHAAVARGMLVPAFEALTGVAKHHRTGGHELTAERRSVLKAPCHDDGDRDMRVLLFEGMILGTGCADHIGHAPSRHSSQDAR